MDRYTDKKNTSIAIQLEKLEIEHVYEWGAMGNLQCLCVNKGK